jgi:cephalosporin hydroxylase
VRPTLPVHVDIAASIAALAANEHVHDGMLKLPVDLQRYAMVIEATRPEVVVETGTRTGASARWFATHGVDVITIDIRQTCDTVCTDFKQRLANDREIRYVLGDSADPETAKAVRLHVAGRRCMVSLDSDHSASHVAREIEMCGPLVTPGCYLVVEDTIFGYASDQLRAQHCPDMVGSPLDAIASHLDGNPAWSRDVEIERLAPQSQHPAGWWVRRG